MYELEWASRERWAAEPEYAQAADSQLPRERVAETLLLHWQEHCLECAPPQCYEVCPLYVARADRRCARLVYGLYPNRAFSGLFDHGVDVRFRRWGKVETSLFGRSASVTTHRALDKLDLAATKAVNVAGGALERVDPARRVNHKVAHYRERMLRRLPKAPDGGYDDFVLECWSAETEPLRLIVEYVRDELVALRHAFDIRPGHNFHTLPAAQFGPIEEDTTGRVLVYPENDAECRLIFTWLDFVRYRDGSERTRPSRPTLARRDGRRAETATVAPQPPASRVAAEPAEKVKCVAWDLDNTLWKGVLIEDTSQGCRVREEALELVRALDERGIIQTVVSKNDHDEAWALVTELGLQDYFLYPAINWGQKSLNLQQIAKRLNINIDTFALIDDSPFERAEVKDALPMVRVYSEQQLGEVLGLPEFDVPITEMSRKRRLSYLAEVEREQAAAEFSGDYLEFLRRCGMRMRLFVPEEEAQVVRCMELVQRSNQLNLSKRDYSEQEFRALLATPGITCVAIECGDRFGHYGIVGFAAVDERPETPLVRDYVLSCRVAQKRVEHTFFEWLAEREAAQGRTRLRAELVRTDRNGALVKVFEELPFEAVESDGPRTVMEMALDEIGPPADVIDLRDEVGA